MNQGKTFRSLDDLARMGPYLYPIVVSYNSIFLVLIKIEDFEKVTHEEILEFEDFSDLFL